MYWMVDLKELQHALKSRLDHSRVLRRPRQDLTGCKRRRKRKESRNIQAQKHCLVTWSRMKLSAGVYNRSTDTCWTNDACGYKRIPVDSRAADWEQKHQESHSSDERGRKPKGSVGAIASEEEGNQPWRIKLAQLDIYRKHMMALLCTCALSKVTSAALCKVCNS